MSQTFQTKAIIIGSGVSGISAAYYLNKANIPYIILEKSDELGGTWRDYNFHGCRVDTENVEYCFSFNVVLDKYTTRWTKQQVQNYIKDTAIKFNIYQNIIFNTAVQSINFSTKENKWYVYDQNNKIYCSNFIYNCNGFSNTSPYIPSIENKDEYEGKIIHAIKLDEKMTFTNDKVVVVGSGATMASLVPKLQEVCKKLTIVQRSPTYIYESDDKPDFLYEVVRILNDIFKNNDLVKFYQFYRMIDDEIIFTALRYIQPLSKKFFRSQWEGILPDEFINKHLTPKHNVLEQRIPVSLGLRDLIKNRKIDIETGNIQKFFKNGLIVDGNQIECNVIILATGFNLNFFNFPIKIDNTEVDTKKLNWYKGLLLGEIPNYFQAIGCFDCSWTQRVESAYKLASEIILHTSKNNFKIVKVPIRKNLKQNYVFNPNYIKRTENVNPIIYGITFIPTIDYIFSFNLELCDELIFI